MVLGHIECLLQKSSNNISFQLLISKYSVSFVFLSLLCSDITIDITDFDQNVLKNTKDTQIIQGRWTINEVRFLGKNCKQVFTPTGSIDC